ncbi:MAG TPA: ATP-binding protein, partial [Opitutus sp.]|nr:ATP-binding protein [Opitutus sp.]
MASRLLPFFYRSFRGRLALLVGAVLLPAAVLVAWLIYAGYQDERRELERRLIAAARAVSLIVDSEMAEREALLQGLATSGRLQRGDLLAFREQAKVAARGADEWIVLIDTQGQQLVNTLLPPDAPLPLTAFKPEFRETVEAGRTYISNLTMGPASKRPVLFTAIPLFEGGQLRYTLNYAVTPAVFGPALSGSGVGPEWVVAIIDRNGVLAARSRQSEQFVGVKAGPLISEAITKSPEGVVESVTLDGVRSITAFTRAEVSGWHVVVAAPASELYASAERLLVVALGVSLLLGVAASLLALWIGRGVVSAVNTLVAETEALGRGEPLQTADTGIEETNIVVRALAESGKRLVAREAELKEANESLTSAARALREKQERLDAARTAASTGTFVWHLDRGLFESDESLNALFALAPGTGLRSVGQFLDLVHPEDRPAVKQRLEQCARSESDFAIEFRAVRPDGATRHLVSKGRAFASTEGNGRYIAAACVDVTERKQTEAEIARTRDAALAASRAKDEFLAALSHELRTPLNPVLLVASDAAQNPDYPAEARQAFSMIAKNAALEARLIDDLLDLTRITRGKLLLDLQRLDLRQVLEDAIANVRPDLNAQAQLLTTTLPSGLWVNGDPTRLQQVFWNVLKNAVKFTPEGGRVVVNASTLDERVHVTIADSGMGMTPEELSRVFQTFVQGDHALSSSAHRFGGLGLGLAISRMLVELHAGRIEARSGGRGAGAEFTIDLPLAAAEKGAPVGRTASPTVAASGGAGRRVLLVEDHDATRIAVKRLLERRRFHVEAAASASDALRLSDEATFDLVIS